MPRSPIWNAPWAQPCLPPFTGPPMKNNPTAAIATAVLTVLLAGCSPKTDSPPETQTADNVTITAAQRARLHVQTIRPTAFHRVIETTGTVNFDNDRATTVLAPISGPASRLLVSLGARVQAGDPLALVDSPDYAA